MARRKNPARRARTRAKPSPARRRPARPTGPLVAIGASAGGLTALTQVLRAMPALPGAPVVFVQHLSPSRESGLRELLASSTRMEVVQAREGMPLRADHVHVVPPNAHVTVAGGRLRLAPRPEGSLKHSAIDVLFRSVATEAGESAIGVLLSGNSSDGVAGLREIKIAGGVTMVQTPESADYDVMPRAAVSAGVADMALEPADIGVTLVRLLRGGVERPRDGAADDHAELPDHQLRRLFGLLRNATGVDFRHYKEPTIRRRVLRRMMLNRHDGVDSYIRQLEQEPHEVHSLYHDLLIQVTRFFRDPESFVALRQSVFGRIVGERQPDQPIRVWVPGCATGEEPYSIAMELIDYVGRDALPSIQIFATDVSDRAVERARAGIYASGIVEDVPPERLRRFFHKVDGGYQITRAVRDVCVFARQDLTRDPPFSKLDLVVCRNVLIYLDPVLHRRLMSVFHCALKPDRFLVLGRAESVGAQSELFEIVDKKVRIFRRKPSTTRIDLDYHLETNGAAAHAPQRRSPGHGRDGGGVQAEATRLLMGRFAPPAVLVDNDLRIVHTRGQTGPYLELAPGDASLNILKMAREGLLYGLRAAINEARKSAAPVTKGGLRVKMNGHSRTIGVEVIPLPAAGAADRHFLILFVEPGRALAAAPAPRERARNGRSKARGAAEREDGQVRQLQEELAASREYLQSIIQDLEATNEELQSANEEILSSNEELQSTNEELDTAKEELQSTNEEINTVNEELQSRNDELSRANSDLLNLLAGVQIAIVFLTSDLRVRRFTPMAEKALNLIPSDVGRPIGNIRPNIDCPDLEQIIHQVVDTVTIQEREVRDREGRWMLLRVRPYKSIDNRIDGAVLVLLDIDAVRSQEECTRAALDFAQRLLSMVHEPLLVLDAELRVQTLNRAFARLFRVDERADVGKSVFDMAGGRWSTPEFHALMDDVARQSHVEDYELFHDVPGVGRRRLLVNAQRIASVPGSGPAIMLALTEAPGAA